MFILSAGMPKSSSTLFSFYQKSILENSIIKNGQKEFEQLIKEGIIAGVGIFVYNLELPETLGKLTSLSEAIGPFIVKTHSNLTAEILELLKNKQILATYIHRDPRDVILSAIDHGTRPLDHPTMSPFFLQFNSVQNSIPLVKKFCRTGIDWVRSGLCEVYTYHNLIVDPAKEISRFCEFIHVRQNSSFIQELINTFTVNKIKWRRQFNTGKLLRYIDEMSPQEIEICNQEMFEEMQILGYLTLK